MDKIPSFSKNHNAMDAGLSVSMNMHGVTTFDLRFKKPNTEFLSAAAAHTIEHLVATTLRNSDKKDDIIYFGPMGCMTGFYLLTVNLTYGEVKNLLIDCIRRALTLGNIPGNKKSECGNYKSHNLTAAKRHLSEYLKVLENIHD